MNKQWRKDEAVVCAVLVLTSPLFGVSKGPEANSGEDAYRNMALEAPIGSFITMICRTGR